MSLVRLRAVTWEVIGSIVGFLASICYFIEKAYEKRQLLLKGAKLAIKAARWSTVRFVGLSVFFLSGVTLAVLPVASFLFVQAGIAAPRAMVPLALGAVIADFLYGFVGLVGLGTGLWIVAPKSRVGQFGQNLVMVRILRRKKNKKKPVSFLATTCLGLIQKLIPRPQ